MQIFFILVPKAKICRKIRLFPMDFPADFSFEGLKPKDLNIQGLICNNKKIQRLKPNNCKLTGTKMMIKPN
jgi:hypothetical protein